MQTVSELSAAHRCFSELSCLTGNALTRRLAHVSMLPTAAKFTFRLVSPSPKIQLDAMSTHSCPSPNVKEVLSGKALQEAQIILGVPTPPCKSLPTSRSPVAPCDSTLHLSASYVKLTSGTEQQRPATPMFGRHPLLYLKLEPLCYLGHIA